MGSVRRRLILTVLFALPTAAIAEVCDKERPGWTRSDGPATGLDEFIHLATLPLTLVMVALAVTAFMSRRPWFQILMALFWGMMALVQIGEDAPVVNDVRWFAIQEGCIGPPHLFIGFAIAICAVMIIGALRPRKTGDSRC